MEYISVLGSAGSIGRQTLDVSEKLGIRVRCLAGGSNIDTLEAQARKFTPELVAVRDEDRAAELKSRLFGTGVRVLGGQEGVFQAAEADAKIVAAISGMEALLPVLRAAGAGRYIALANKEAMVCAGSLIFAECRRTGAEIVPVDSEHSALFQCLRGSRREDVRRLLLTASGGPFFGWDREKLKTVTPEMALRHPNWSMGAKITVDSATMMNKGLELIEAMRLYDMPREKITIVIHRESIIHSMVEYNDNALIAQLGTPDMRLPIQYALTAPRREEGAGEALDILSCPPLSFYRPDYECFPCLGLAEKAADGGELLCTVMNAANEIAVSAFLRGELAFTGIAEVVSGAMAAETPAGPLTLDNILAFDRAARQTAKRLISEKTEVIL